MLQRTLENNSLKIALSNSEDQLHHTKEELSEMRRKLYAQEVWPSALGWSVPWGTSWGGGLTNHFSWPMPIPVPVPVPLPLSWHIAPPPPPLWWHNLLRERKGE